MNQDAMNTAQQQPQMDASLLEDQNHSHGDDSFANFQKIFGDNSMHEENDSPNRVEVQEQKDVIQEKTPQDKQPSQDYYQLFEEEKKRNAQVRKWGDELSRQLKAAKKEIETLVESDILDEDDAKRILKSIRNEDIKQQPHGDDPFATYLLAANQELDVMRRYRDDQDFDHHVQSFDLFWNDATPEEKHEFMETIEDHKDDSLTIAKLMLAKGKDYYNDTYRHVKEHGGFKGFVKYSLNTLSKLQKQIDSFTNKSHNKNETSQDLKPQSYKLPSGSSTQSGPELYEDAADVVNSVNKGKLQF